MSSVFFMDGGRGYPKTYGWYWYRRTPFEEPVVRKFSANTIHKGQWAGPIPLPKDVIEGESPKTIEGDILSSEIKYVIDQIGIWMDRQIKSEYYIVFYARAIRRYLGVDYLKKVLRVNQHPTTKWTGGGSITEKIGTLNKLEKAKIPEDVIIKHSFGTWKKEIGKKGSVKAAATALEKRAIGR